MKTKFHVMILGLLFLLAPVMLVAIALLAGDADIDGVWRAGRFAPLPFTVLSAIQLSVALGAAAVIAVAVSVAGSIMRWLLCQLGLLSDARPWFGVTTEGMIVGLAAAGLWLGWAPTDIYPCHEGARRIEIRRPSLLEGPLGMHYGCSDCLVPVTVTYRDEDGRTVTQRDCEYRYGTSAERVCNRTIRWGTKQPPRVVVELPLSSDCLFFPEPVDSGHGTLPAHAIGAYLRGEPVAAVQRLCREAQTGQH